MYEIEMLAHYYDEIVVSFTSIQIGLKHRVSKTSTNKNSIKSKFCLAHYTISKF